MPSNVKSKDRSRGKTKKGKVKRKKRTKRNSEQDGSEGDLELDRELYPIGHYLSDRAEMVEQMFGILKKDKIQSMLPPILKEIQWPDLKTHCLDQLNSMSEKQIIRILEGKPNVPEQENDEVDKAQNVDLVMSSTSSSSTSSCGELSSGSSSQHSSDSEPEAEPELAVKKSSAQPISVKADPDKVEDDPDMLQIGLSPKEMGDLLGDDEDLQRKEKQQSVNVSLEKREKEICTEDGKTVKDEKSGDATCGKKGDSKGGKTLLEILELEMRARAIRALLKKSSSAIPGEPTPGSSNSTKKVEVSEKSKSKLASTSKRESVVVKEEVLSDEDDVVFVDESLLKKLPPKESEKQVKQKECLSAVYDASTDILKFKPTVMSTTSKVSLVDTSGNPIILPKVKSQPKVRTVDPTVIVIDNDVNDNPSSSKSVSNDPKCVLGKDSGILKRRADLTVEVKSRESSKHSSDSDKPKSKLTRIVTNKSSDTQSASLSPPKETFGKSLSTRNQTAEKEGGTASAKISDAREEIKANGEKVLLDVENAGS